MTRAGLVAGLAIVMAGGVDAQDFEWSGSLRAGQEIQIKGIIGSITAVPGSGDVIVTATKHGRRSDFDEVTFEVVEMRDGVMVCALYPPRRNRAAECDPDGSYDIDWDNAEVEVEFNVRLPAGVRIKAQTIDGDVRVRGATARVTAVTVNGDIDIETTDIAKAVSVSGSLHVSMGSDDWREDLAFTTVSGDITLELPANIDADVTMTTMSGDLESDFPLTMRGRGWVNLGMRGMIGQGGPDLKLTTVNGDVTLARR